MHACGRGACRLDGEVFVQEGDLEKKLAYIGTKEKAPRFLGWIASGACNFAVKPNVFDRN
jgi:hypothetical protein